MSKKKQRLPQPHECLYLAKSPVEYWVEQIPYGRQVGDWEWNARIDLLFVPPWMDGEDLMWRVKRKNGRRKTLAQAQAAALKAACTILDQYKRELTRVSAALQKQIAAEVARVTRMKP